MGAGCGNHDAGFRGSVICVDIYCNTLSYMGIYKATHLIVVIIISPHPTHQFNPFILNSHDFILL